MKVGLKKGFECWTVGMLGSVAAREFLLQGLQIMRDRGWVHFSYVVTRQGPQFTKGAGSDFYQGNDVLGGSHIQIPIKQPDYAAPRTEMLRWHEHQVKQARQWTRRRHN